MVATVEVDPAMWLVLAEYHQTDAFVMAVEAWAALDPRVKGPPPTAEAWLRAVLAERRRTTRG